LFGEECNVRWRMCKRGEGGRRVDLRLLSVCVLLFVLSHSPLLIIFYYIFIHPLPFVLVVMVRCGSFSEEDYYIEFSYSLQMRVLLVTSLCCVLRYVHVIVLHV
jgi:hypothetical protein